MKSSLSAMRALVLGSALGLGSALAPTLRSLQAMPQMVTGSRNRGKGKGSGTLRKWVRARTLSSKRRDLSDPVQAALFQAAEAKRERRALKRDTDSSRSYIHNNAHCSDARFDPLFINRSA